MENGDRKRVEWADLCEKKHEFKKDVKFEIVTDDLNYIENWVPENELDMYCYPEYEIALFGSSYFFGLAIGSFFTNIADIIGRKNAMFIRIVMSTVFGITAVFIKNQYTRYASLFLIGLSSIGLFAGYIHVMENNLKKHRGILTSIGQI